MSTKKIILLLLVLSSLAVGSIIAYRGGKNVSYTDAEIEEMSASDLYEVLINNGLQVNEDLKKELTDEQLAEYIKSDFNLLKNGATSRSHAGYKEMADDIKKIYESILRK
ncbi:hypothetical protein E8P77_21535 [Soehngenia saccharolytica]|nr:hypothetical protein E8P77_21535 [Soehngenia saccharolytica]